MIILEVGINHFGSMKEANDYLNFFLKSDYKFLTFQIQKNKFYKKHFKKINYELPLSFYEKALKKAKFKNKKIGLAVCCPLSFKKYYNIKFDFYKLLSIAINDFKLINMLSNLKKRVFISLGKGTDLNIKNCIRKFKKKVNLSLIYTSMSYNPKDLNFDRIAKLKQKFKLPVGYGHHYKDDIAIYMSKYFKSEFLFIYIKKNSKKDRIYPDDMHAIEIKNIKDLKYKLDQIDIILTNKKINTKIKLNDKKISF